MASARARSWRCAWRIPAGIEVKRNTLERARSRGRFLRLLEYHLMKRVGRVLVAVCVGSSLLAGGVFGQSIPPQLKTSASIDKASAQAIELAVAPNVQKLADENPDAQRQAREALIGEVRAAGAEPSAAFMAAYSEALGNAVMKLPKDAHARTLLNAAIVVARVADITKSPKLEPVVLWLLGEQQPEAVKLWGMKAARGIMPEL